MSATVGYANEDLDRDLFAHLENIEQRLEDICAEGFLIDPDQIMSQLSDETTFVQDCVSRLMEDIEDHPERLTNLNQVVDMASRELLMTVPFPVVVRISMDQTVPELAYADEVVLAAVLRALQLCTEHAGPGCEVQVSTSAVDSSVVLAIETRGCQPFNEPSLPIKLRSISLSDLVTSFGGGMSVTQQRDVLTIKVTFGTKSPIY